MKIAAFGAVIAGLVLAGVELSTSAGVPEVSVLDGFRRTQTIAFPEDNRYSDAKQILGKMLFFDPLLSGSGMTSCATCHRPDLAWGDGLPRAVGEGRKAMALRTPTLIDIAAIEPLGWDGKFKDLEAVPFGPILSPANMNLTEAELVGRLSRIRSYSALFSDAFGDSGVNRPRIEQALATFQRTIVAGEAPFDRWVNGEENAIDHAAKRGFALFNGKARCSACHSGPSFTDGSFHDIGTAQGDDLGRGALFPSSKTLRHAFKTPTLRDVTRRAPYMHDGSIASLDEVIVLYDKGGIDRPSRSPHIRPLALTAHEKADLITFLETLTSEQPPMAAPALPRD